MHFLTTNLCLSLMTGELTLLVVGLGAAGGETSIEYIIGPADDLTDDVDPVAVRENQIIWSRRSPLLHC